ncbi:MAG: hypothetical protein HON25_11090 [Gammaproteobacteria bacterium]|nr:hypothetical protein [Gammaproteobacteria bacterium]MBT3694994.1 hypothetical protein [Gammaproteobacteria bacterium]MBT5682433.1 hypothetical protein [Gammaproteobacteria bacterium]MBT6024981.1 hypothetical protein [Gammaproteobacteria bacterium]MBT6558936.1 hypothetical protein [Gammaproteobacteria bacterium]
MGFNQNGNIDLRCPNIHTEQQLTELVVRFASILAKTYFVGETVYTVS